MSKLFSVCGRAQQRISQSRSVGLLVRVTQWAAATLILVAVSTTSSQGRADCVACNVVKSGGLSDIVGARLVHEDGRVVVVRRRPNTHQVQIQFPDGSLHWVDASELYTPEAIEQRRARQQAELRNCECQSERSRAEEHAERRSDRRRNAEEAPSDRQVEGVSGGGRQLVLDEGNVHSMPA
jgi:hypothetical protein